MTNPSLKKVESKKFSGDFKGAVKHKRKLVAQKMPHHKVAGFNKYSEIAGEYKTKHGFNGTENMNEMGGNTGIKPKK